MIKQAGVIHNKKVGNSNFNPPRLYAMRHIN